MQTTLSTCTRAFACGTLIFSQATRARALVQARAQGADLRVTSISPGMVETEFAAVAAFGDAAGAAAKYNEFRCLQVIIARE